MVAAARDPLPLQALLCTAATHARNRRLLSTLGQSTPAARMAKMKKGKAHHWYKEEKDKVPKKSYVPTGENSHQTRLARIFVFICICSQGSREGVQRSLQEKRSQSMSQPEPRGEGSLVRRTANDKISVSSMLNISAALHNQ